MRRFYFVSVLLLTLLTVTGASAKFKFNSVDITGASCCKNFHLTDDLGNARTLTDFRGKVVVMFFGYTHCPDVCPTTLVSLEQVMKQLGPDAEQVQVLFVTLDPNRDSRTVLKNYVTAFDPHFIGLYGDVETTMKTARSFRVYYHKRSGKGGDYTIDHTAGCYVFDKQGRIRLFVPFGREKSLVADIRTLLDQ